MTIRIEELEAFVRALADDTHEGAAEEIEFWQDAAKALVARLDDHADAH